jgi:uncharacterized protein YjbI with pentapeptide repeats
MSATNKTFLPRKNSQTKAEELARLDKIVENSSEKNRNFFIAYLGLLIYAQAIIFSTTDLQLLVSTDGLKLPLIDLNVPLVGFYVVVPIFIIALHFNFLQNLESHHYKLMQWQAAHMGGQVPRKFIYPFLFDYAILEQGSQFQRLVKIANSLLCYNLAPITLGLLLIRFSDRQEWLTSLWHYLFFLFDSILVWQFRRAILHNELTTTKSQSPTKLKFNLKSFFKSTLNISLRWLLIALVSAEMMLTFAIGGTSDNFFEKNIQPKLQPFTRMNVFESEEAWVQILSQAISNPIEWFLPRIYIDPNETVWHINRSELENLARLAGYKDWLIYFQEQDLGFRPETTNLKFLSIQGQRLPRANFIGAKMQGADLSLVRIKDGFLIGANLHGANLTSVNMEKAGLSGINLQNAELRNANLSFAYLDSATLLGANLASAKLTGANFNHANLIGVNLSQTEAYNADFSFASLQGANLTFAQLQGSNLHAANLTGTSLHVTLLLGADLTYTKMVGADLTNTQMTGAILDATDLRGTSPSPDWWSGYFIVQDYGYKIEESSGGTAISGGTVGIPQSSVNITENPVEKEKPDWERLKLLSENILNPKLKKDYEDIMTSAEKRFNSVKDLPVFKHFPSGLAYQVIVQLCRSPDSLFAITGARQNYSNLEHRLNEYEGFPQAKVKVSQIPEAKLAIKEIDRQLCLLDECATIREDIDELDCKPFLKTTPKK